MNLAVNRLEITAATITSYMAADIESGLPWYQRTTASLILPEGGAFPPITPGDQSQVMFKFFERESVEIWLFNGATMEWQVKIPTEWITIQNLPSQKVFVNFAQAIAQLAVNPLDYTLIAFQRKIPYVIGISGNGAIHPKEVEFEMARMMALVSDRTSNIVSIPSAAGFVMNEFYLDETLSPAPIAGKAMREWKQSDFHGVDEVVFDGNTMYRAIQDVPRGVVPITDGAYWENIGTIKTSDLQVQINTLDGRADTHDAEIAALDSRADAHATNLDTLNDFRAWDSARAYSTNDPVFRNGQPYRAKQSTTNNDPATDTAQTYWEPVGGGGGSAGVGNIFPDPQGSKGPTGWTGPGTVETIANGLTGFSTELSITGQEELSITVPSALRGEELELRFEGFVNNAGQSISITDASDNVIPSSGSIPATSGKFQFVGRFWGAGTASIKLKITGTGNLRMTQVYLGRREVVYGAAIGPWTDYTPTFTGFGTPAGVSFRHRRVGESLEIEGRFTAGTTTASEAQMTLPAGLSIVSTLPALASVGYAAGTKSSSTHLSFGVLAEPSKGYVCFGLQSTSTGGLSKRPGSQLADSGDSISFSASIPISQWTGSGTVQMAEAGGAMYLSNTESVTNTNGVVGKSYYGVEGAPIVSNTAATYYDITLPRALLPDEVPVLEVRSKVDGNWVPVEIAGVPTLFIGSLRQGIVEGGLHYEYGYWVAKPSGSPSVIRVYASSGVGGGNTGFVGTTAVLRTWANITSAADGYDRWRVRIEKAGGARQETPTVYARYDATLSNGAYMTGGNKVEDTHGKYVGNEWIVPFDGIYIISGNLISPGQGVNNIAAGSIYVNGGGYPILEQLALAGFNVAGSYCLTLKLKRGDRIAAQGNSAFGCYMKMMITRIGA